MLDDTMTQNLPSEKKYIHSSDMECVKVPNVEGLECIVSTKDDLQTNNRCSAEYKFKSQKKDISVAFMNDFVAYFGYMVQSQNVADSANSHSHLECLLYAIADARFAHSSISVNKDNESFSVVYRGKNFSGMDIATNLALKMMAYD